MQTFREPDSLQASITVSIVSHNHGPQVLTLIKQVLRDSLTANLILTLNANEHLTLPSDSRLTVIENSKPKGFGANHNSAFEYCRTPYFCVLNPDIVLQENTFEHLIRCLKNSKAAVCGPLVLSPTGSQEDSWRRFPNLVSLFLKAIGHDTTILKQRDESEPFFPDWIAGMCMLFDSIAYNKIGGFDEKFFLYYEDVDICARLWKEGQAVSACYRALVTHNAQRASRTQWQHMKWHAVSMARYLTRYSLSLPKITRNCLTR